MARVTSAMFSALPEDASKLSKSLRVFLMLVLCSSLHPSSVNAIGFHATVNPRCSDIRSFEIGSAIGTNASQVNVTIEPTAVPNLLSLYDNDNPVNVTVIIRRPNEIGPLCVYLNLTSVSAKGDASSPPSTIGIRGLPLLVSEDDSASLNWLDDVVEIRFVIQVSGTRLGRARLMVTALQELADQEWTTVSAVRLPAFEVGVFFH
jgi:hypothetical protein